MAFEAVREETRALLADGSFHGAERAESIWRKFLEKRSVSRRDRGRAKAAMAQTVIKQGSRLRVGEVRELYEDALRLVDDPSDRIAVIVAYGLLVKEWNVDEPAGRLAGELEALAETCMNPVMVAWAWIGFSRMMLALRRPDEAASSARRAYLLALDHNGAISEALKSEGEALLALGRLAQARESLEEALVHANSGHCVRDTRADLGLVAIAEGERDAAVFHLTKAVELPDYSDRQVERKVLKAVRALLKIDPNAADRLLEILEAHLESA
jgi:tetratricopeptide (TPR) repeat protein